MERGSGFANRQTGQLRPYMTMAHDGLPLVVFNIESPHIRKLDANGGTLWDRTYSSSSFYDGHNESISVDGSGNIVTGLQELQDTNYDAHLYQFAPDGSPGWSTPAVISDFVYLLEGYAQSVTIDAVAGNISQANLTADFELNAGSVAFYLSNNGGTTWGVGRARCHAPLWHARLRPALESRAERRPILAAGADSSFDPTSSTLQLTQGRTITSRTTAAIRRNQSMRWAHRNRTLST